MEEGSFGYFGVCGVVLVEREGGKEREDVLGGSLASF